MGDTNCPNEKLKRIEEMFKEFRLEMDARHDLQEKLVKKSRDITLESKRIIFHMHRIKDNNKDSRLLNEAKIRLQNVYELITHGIGSLLILEDVHQYLRAFSPGLQEFVEAISFYYYLKFGKLVSMDEINQASFLFETDVAPKEEDDKKMPMEMLLMPLDYILGVADLTGELMRKCIASGNLEEPFQLRKQLKHIYDAFLMIRFHSGREMVKKTYTLKSSLQKVEDACYSIRVRGSELSKLMLKNEQLAGQKVLVLADLFNTNSDMPVEDDYS